MITVRVGKATMFKRQKFTGGVLLSLVLLVPSVLFLVLIMQRSRAGDEDVIPRLTKMLFKHKVWSCPTKECPSDQFSFYVQSGAANVVAPKICIQNKMVLGYELSNTGQGINVVIMNAKTGVVTKTDHFLMHGGEDVERLIKLLKDIETGSAVLMASFDEPSTKLNEEAKELIAELGSSSVQSLGFRDSWGFVGVKGSAAKINFEKHIKNVKETNKYSDWPELISLDGCIPKFLE